MRAAARCGAAAARRPGLRGRRRVVERRVGGRAAGRGRRAARRCPRRPALRRTTARAATAGRTRGRRRGDRCVPVPDRRRRFPAWATAPCCTRLRRARASRTSTSDRPAPSRVSRSCTKATSSAWWPTTCRPSRRAIAAIEVVWDEPREPAEAELVEYLRAHPIELEGRGGAIGAGRRRRRRRDRRRRRSRRAARTRPRTSRTCRSRPAPRSRRGTTDRLTVWTGTQRPFGTRAALARGDGRRRARGAGRRADDRHRLRRQALARGRDRGRAARARGGPAGEGRRGPARRSSSTDTCGRRPSSTSAAGATSDGNLVGWELTNVNAGRRGLVAPYAVANRRERFEPVGSPLRQGSYRALAATVNNFARESILDELAHELRIDPLELRLRNLGDDRLACRRARRGRSLRLGRPAARRRRRFGHRARLGEGRARRDLRGGARRRRRRLDVLRIVTAFECGAVVSEDDLPPPDRGRDRHGPGRRAVRGGALRAAGGS